MASEAVSLPGYSQCHRIVVYRKTSLFPRQRLAKVWEAVARFLNSLYGDGSNISNVIKLYNIIYTTMHKLSVSFLFFR